jgi:hypothetical protein
MEQQERGVPREGLVQAGAGPAEGDAENVSLELYLLLYPQELEPEVLQLLDGVGVPGYTEFPKLVGRGHHARHFDNQIWPGATGATFTVIDTALESGLDPALREFDRMIRERSGGLHRLHVFCLPCRQLL